MSGACQFDCSCTSKYRWTNMGQWMKCRIEDVEFLDSLTIAARTHATPDSEHKPMTMMQGT